MSTVAHAVASLLLTAGLFASVQRRPVLSKLLAFGGIAVGHLPDLLAAAR
jgi:hypothetical protein